MFFDTSARYQPKLNLVKRENSPAPSMCMRRGKYGIGSLCNPLADVDAAYIAGLIDGEGYVGFRYQSPNPRYKHGRISLCVAFTMTTPYVLEWLSAVTGLARRSRGFQPKIKHHSLTYNWCVTAAGGASLLEQVRPYLRLKGPQADFYLDTHRVLIESQELATNRDWQEETRERFRALREKGKATPRDRAADELKDWK